jgi:hypothetical protein
MYVTCLPNILGISFQSFFMVVWKKKKFNLLYHTLSKATNGFNLQELTKKHSRHKKKFIMQVACEFK